MLLIRIHVTKLSLVVPSIDVNHHQLPIRQEKIPDPIINACHWCGAMFVRETLKCCQT
jgi:hypothetical protein